MGIKIPQYTLAFNEWYDSKEWWKDNKQDVFEAYLYAGGGYNHDMATKALEIMMFVMAEEYGE